MLTSLVPNSGIDQATVLATREEPALSVVLREVKILNLVEKTKRGEVFKPTAGHPIDLFVVPPSLSDSYLIGFMSVVEIRN